MMSRNFGNEFRRGKGIWQNGSFEGKIFWLPTSERARNARKGIFNSFAANVASPIGFDYGGKPQLNAARKALEKYGNRTSRLFPPSNRAPTQ